MIITTRICFAIFGDRVKKTLIAILFVTLFVGMIFIPVGVSRSDDDIQPQGSERDKWFFAAITGGLLVEEFSYDKHFEILNIFTNFEITGTVILEDFFPLLLYKSPDQDL